MLAVIIRERKMTESELMSLKSIKNDKSPGNDGLTKEFYETFWEEIRKSFLKEKLSVSQKQAVIKLIEEKDRDKDKRLIKKWRPNSLLNVDSKLIPKSLANTLQDVMPNLVTENQSAYVNNRFIKRGRKVYFGYSRNYRFTSNRRTFK